MRVRTEAKREAILKAASEIFLASGFERASMSEIAARVGGSKATLYGYFSSKEELFLEVTHGEAKKQILPIFSALAEDHDNLPLALQRFGEKTLAVMCSVPSVQARRAIIAESGRSEIGMRFFEDGPRKGVEELANFLEHQMDEGRLRRADPLVAALHLTALLDSETISPLLLGIEKKLSKAFIQQAVARALEAFLGGYAKPITASEDMTKVEVHA